MTAPLALANQGDFLTLQKRLIEIFRDHRTSIVRVKAAYDTKAPNELPQVIIGSGFFISREGHVLTNASVVLEPDRVWVVHEGVEYAAETIGVDRGTNLALLKVNTLPKQFTFLPLGDSSELPEPGTIVVRLGSPLELAPSPSLGMVSGIESRFGSHYFSCAHIRTTIPAGPGDGGAAYLDLTGRLVGIQVGSLSEIDSTYVLPARAALRIRDDLLFSGKVTFGWVGFEVKEEPSAAEGARILLREVMEGTPAREAGMLPGDELLRIGDQAIRNIEDLRNAMFYSRVGEYVPVRLKRDGRELDLTVRLVARPENEPMRSGTFLRPDGPSSPLRNPEPVNPGEVEAPGPAE